ncbi:MAG: glycoside hydrolase family 65 protein, partial [Agrococcus casei]
MINRDRFPLDPWRLVEAQYSTDDLGAAETIFAVGNGYLGIRGSSEVGGRASEHGTFVNGFHEVYPIQHAEQAFGFAEVGQTIINAPDAKVMRVYVDDEPLALETADLRDYERALDFRTGQLTMSLLWILPSGKEVRVETRRMVSFDERHLALASVRVTVLNADAAVTISCQVINRQDRDSEYGVAQAENGFDPRKADQFSERVLQPSESWHDGLRTALSYKVTNSGMTLGVIADHRIETENRYDARTVVEPDLAKSVFRVRASAGVPTQVTKYFSYHTGDDVAPRELLNRGRRTVDRALALGAEK